jgi:MFS family permease
MRLERGLKKFMTIWIGQTLSLFGSSLTEFGLSVWVYQQTGSPSQFGFMIATALIPFIVFSPLGGIMADRYDRRKVMFIGDIISGLSIFTLVLLFISDAIEVWHIFIVAFVGSIGMAFQLPAYSTLIPQMVKKEDYVRANGLLNISEGLSQIIAPAIAGLLLTLVGLGVILIIDMSTLLFSLYCLWRSKYIILEVELDQDNKPKRIPIGLVSFVEALQYLKNRPFILLLIALFSVNNVVFGLVETLLAPYMLKFANPQLYGLMLSIGSIGMVVGSIIITIWNKIKHKMLIILIFNGILGISLSLLGFESGLVVMSIILFVAFFCVPFIDVPAESILQTKVPHSLQGRVFSIRNQIEYSGVPLGAILAGVLAERVFEPSMSLGGDLTFYFGWLLGAGPGRGIALLFFLSGVLMLAATIIIYSRKNIRIEDKY